MIANPTIQGGGGEPFVKIMAKFAGDGWAKIYDIKDGVWVDLSLSPVSVTVNIFYVLIKGGDSYQNMTFICDGKTIFPNLWRGPSYLFLTPEEYPNGFSEFDSVEVVAEFYSM